MQFNAIVKIVNKNESCKNDIHIIRWKKLSCDDIMPTQHFVQRNTLRG